jgi:hypothetical protein
MKLHSVDGLAAKISYLRDSLSALATALLFFTLLVLPDETSYHQLLLPGDFACDEHKIRIPCQELSVVV